MTINKVQKSGNSFYVTLPREYLRHLGISPKDYVVVKLLPDKIEILPIDKHIEERSKCKKKK